MDKWKSFTAGCILLYFFGGCIKTNGIFLNELVMQFKTTHAMVAWAFALQHGVSYLFAPFTEVMISAFGKRRVGVSGGLLVGSAYVYLGISAQSTWQLFCAYVSSGVGFGMIVISVYIYLQEQFKEKFPFVNSIVSLFNFVGLSTLPPAIQYLKACFGVRNALVLMGTLLWNLVLCGLLFSKPELQRKSEEIVTIQDLTTSKQTETSPETENTFGQKSEGTVQKVCNMLGVSPFLFHKTLSIFVILESLGFFVYISWAIFLVPFGTSIGLPPDEAVFLSTAGGLGGIVGKVFAVVLFHFNKMNSYTSCFVPFLVNGLSLLASMFTKKFFQLAALMFVSGAAQGLHSSAMFGLLPSMVCHFHFHQTVVITYLVDGVAIQLGGLISGKYLKKIGSSYT
ncbi:Monocarboxylate transporter 7 [Holothuria leucospilota]|uniref:Monocarboxylate transporter 7 n=1 Tax=Holothuria leucospilota TaxID=206669 RepID=A0A9Q1BSN7_HOLLE|nr:Monocarboxylate transporter 7 [Holothuria leucospilota]